MGERVTLSALHFLFPFRSPRRLPLSAPRYSPQRSDHTFIPPPSHNNAIGPLGGRARVEWRTGADKLREPGSEVGRACIDSVHVQRSRTEPLSKIIHLFSKGEDSLVGLKRKKRQFRFESETAKGKNVMIVVD